MKKTELEKAVEQLIEAARAHSAFILGEDVVDLPEDPSMLPEPHKIRAIASYLRGAV